MTTFTLYWLDGAKTVCEGDTIQNAFTTAGFGQGAIKALDFYSSDGKDNYIWNGHKWESIKCDTCKFPKFMCICDTD